jgi:hypothetical protein
MPTTNVTLPSELIGLVHERERLWGEFDRTRGLADELKGLSGQITPCDPASVNLEFLANSAPAVELEAVLPRIKENLATRARLQAEVKSCHAEIAAVMQKDRSLMIGLIVGGVVAFVILLIVIVSLLSSSSS